MGKGKIYEQGLDRSTANFPQLSPLSFIGRTAAVYPDHVSVIHGQKRFTWSETYARCRRLAGALAKREIGVGDTVTVMGANTPEMVEAAFGVPMTGGVLNTLNVRLDAVTITHCLNHGEAKVLITDTEFSGTVKEALAALGRDIAVIDIDDSEAGNDISRERLGEVASLKASAEEMNGWAKQALGLRSVAFEDHSGLGDDSRISAADMMRAMLAVRERLGLKPLLKSFPMRDDQRRIVADHPLAVHAKTGTLNFVSGLSGFVDLPDGTELAFAIFAANTAERDKLSREERERPPGASEWNGRAKRLQEALIERWGVLYAA